MESKKSVFIALIILVAVISVWMFREKTSLSKLSSSSTSQSPLSTRGVERKDNLIGKGPAAQPGDKISVHYTGWLDNGQKTDSSRDRGKPFVFVLGAGQVIRGWDQGIIGMQVGGKRQLTIPPELAYGAAGAEGVVPPNSTLHYDFELLSIEPKNISSVAPSKTGEAALPPPAKAATAEKTATAAATSAPKAVTPPQQLAPRKPLSKPPHR